VLTRKGVDLMTMPAGESSMGLYTGGPSYPARDEIDQDAHQIYETSGRQNDQDVEDWLGAEQELQYHCE
jgi:Protein of unknown function (DUF2934)